MILLSLGTVFGFSARPRPGWKASPPRVVVRHLSASVGKDDNVMNAFDNALAQAINQQHKSLQDLEEAQQYPSTTSSERSFVEPEAQQQQQPRDLDTYEPPTESWARANDESPYQSEEPSERGPRFETYEAPQPHTADGNLMDPRYPHPTESYEETPGKPQYYYSPSMKEKRKVPEYISESPENNEDPTESPAAAMDADFTYEYESDTPEENPPTPTFSGDDTTQPTTPRSRAQSERSFRVEQPTESFATMGRAESSLQPSVSPSSSSFNPKGVSFSTTYGSTTTEEETNVEAQSFKPQDASEEKENKYDLRQSIASFQSLVIGAVVGVFAIFPFTALHHFLVFPSYEGLAQWEWDTVTAAIQGAGFALVYRYALREDLELDRVSAGVLATFVLLRTLVGVRVSMECTALPLQCTYQKIRICFVCLCELHSNSNIYFDVSRWRASGVSKLGYVDTSGSECFGKPSDV